MLKNEPKRKLKRKLSYAAILIWQSVVALATMWMTPAAPPTAPCTMER